MKCSAASRASLSKWAFLRFRSHKPPLGKTEVFFNRLGQKLKPDEGPQENRLMGEIHFRFVAMYR
jgi:hypothetical protein